MRRRFVYGEPRPKRFNAIVNTTSDVHPRYCTVGGALDTDGEGDIDLDDYARMGMCLGGPDGNLSAGCECFDFNDDSDNNLLDYAEFQAGFTANEPVPLLTSVQGRLCTIDRAAPKTGTARSSMARNDGTVIE